MTKPEAIAELIRIWHSPHLDLILRARLGEVIETLKADTDGYYIRPSAEAVQRWIPVSERLPSESGWYFVTVQGMERVSDMVWYYHESHEWNGVSEAQKVLAWMPLPEPYRKDGEA